MKLKRSQVISKGEKRNKVQAHKGMKNLERFLKSTGVYGHK
ncbi:hypothetical protein LCGC14_0971150 [marine sediment metagenome]|uniref:Uncharacterized protein n=1 Tax=marine sediment metagenome TaxID=412755 RepID=A0A0F9NBP9_9ZZZZ